MERLATFETRIDLLVSVNSLVSEHVRFPPEAFPAVGTNERLLAGVNSLMDVELCLAGILLPAFETYQRLLLVGFRVVEEKTAVLKTLSAFRAGKGLVQIVRFRVQVAGMSGVVFVGNLLHVRFLVPLTGWQILGARLHAVIVVVLPLYKRRVIIELGIIGAGIDVRVPETPLGAVGQYEVPLRLFDGYRYAGLYERPVFVFQGWFLLNLHGRIRSRCWIHQTFWI